MLLAPALQTSMVSAAEPMQCSGGTCTFWRDSSIYAGNGQYVGFLHAGSNWVVCQEWGQTVHEGQWYNSWWAWTLRDKGTGSYGDGWGWVNAVNVKGGENNQAYPGVPPCNGAHGMPPQNQAPAPTPVPAPTHQQPAQPVTNQSSNQGTQKTAPAANSQTTTPESTQGHAVPTDLVLPTEASSNCHQGEVIIRDRDKVACVPASLRQATSGLLKNDYINSL